MRYIGLLALSLVAAAGLLAACSSDPKIAATETATYCAVKAVTCATPDPTLSADAQRARATWCAINTVCAPAVAASAAGQ